MRVFIGIAVFVVAALGLVVGMLVWLAIDREPLVDRPASISAEQVGRAKRLLAQHDPRRLKPGQRRAMVLNQEDVDVTLNYVVQLAMRGGARVVLQPGFADVAATLPLPATPLGRYANVRAEIMETDGLPAVHSLSIGRLSVPRFLVGAVLGRLVQRAGATEVVELATRLLRHASFGPHSMRVVYEWQEGGLDRLRSAVIPDVEIDRVRQYHKVIADLSAKGDSASVALPVLLVPVFASVAVRSEGGGADAEGRAALLALAAYVTGGGVDMLGPQASRWDVAIPREVTLSGRHDFAKHFLVSAAIAATAGTALANAAGLYKELDDSRGGSGFSFNDIAADAAGTQFGKLVTTGGDAAHALQKRVAAGVDDRDVMPPVDDLPEFMPEQDFVARFGGVGAPKYQEMMADIERRVAGVPIAAKP